MLINPDQADRLRGRIQSELAFAFESRQPVCIAQAPGRIEIIGGLNDYAGAIACAVPLEACTTVAIQARTDRSLQILSFDLFDEHKPFTLIVPLDVLAGAGIKKLRAEFAEPGRSFAAPIAGCLAILHAEGIIDLSNPDIRGANVAVQSAIPPRAGLGHSAAMIRAAMDAICEQLKLATDARLPDRCRRVENQIIGTPSGDLDHHAVAANSAIRMKCLPGATPEPLTLPPGVRVAAIYTGQPVSIPPKQRTRFRCAAYMGHRLILDKMRQIGAAAGRELIKDPMDGRLANLPLDDYKRFFRPYLPETIRGGQFLMQSGSTIDTLTTVEPDHTYAVQKATDFHCFGANRSRNFADFVTRAAAMHDDSPERSKLLNQAGHLLYAAQKSYLEEAELGAECESLVERVRKNERFSLYGAKTSGSGGSVVVLCEEGPQVDEALARIAAEFSESSHQRASVFFTRRDASR